LELLKDFRFSNGQLQNTTTDTISHTWVRILYGRTFIMTGIHYLTVLFVILLSTQLGFFSNKKLDFKFESIQERPNEELVEIFASIKQSFFYKMLAKKKRRIARERILTSCFGPKNEEELTMRLRSSGSFMATSQEFYRMEEINADKK
jgi:hypothetical protein